MCSGLSADVFYVAPGSFGKWSSWHSPSLGCTSSPKQGGKWEPYVGMQLCDVESRIPLSGEEKKDVLCVLSHLFFFHYKIMYTQYAAGTMLLFLANTQDIGTQYWRDLNILHLILQETLIPSAWTKLQKMVLFTADFFSSMLLDPLYCWHFWAVTSIAVAGEGAAHHLLLGWCYSGSSFYWRGRSFSVLCHL